MIHLQVCAIKVTSVGCCPWISFGSVLGVISLIVQPQETKMLKKDLAKTKENVDYGCQMESLYGIIYSE